MDYQTALTTVAYNNTSDNPSTLTRTVSFEINDGDLNSNILSRDIDFTAVNDAPVLSAIETASASYTENDTPLAITGSTTVSDIDDTNIESAVVSISSNFSTDDVLNFTDQNGITGSYDSVNGILTLTGSATLVDYQAALQSITYVNTSDDPSDLTRTVTIQVNDGDVDSNVVSRDINFTAVNDAPTLANIEGVPVSYTEGDPAVSITGNLSLDDLDDVNIESAIVSIGGNLAADDVLNFTDQSSITGNYDSVNGILTLTGSASLVDYQAALQSITYVNTSDNPSDLTRTVTIQINDGDDNSNVVSRDINFIAVNDAPTTALVTLTSIAEDGGARLITQAELLANAIDIEGDALTATGLTIDTGNGALIDNGDGTWSYTPVANDDTDVSFNYLVTDGTDNVVGTAMLDITPVNDAPTTTTPVALTAIAEDSGARLITQAQLLANTNDIEGDALTATGLTINTGNGTLNDNGDGTWTYTPSANDDTDVSFNYTITDGTDNVAGSATLDITPVNDTPTTAPVTMTSIAEDSGVRLITQAELLANANDIDGDGLTAVGLIVNTGNGTLNDNGDGTWTYTPSANDDANVSFAYIVTDGTDNVAGSATLDITPVNDAPTTTPVALTAIAEDSGARLITQTELLANANDIEGDGLTAVGLIINTGNGTLTENGDGTWSYTPAADDDTDVSFAYTVTDGVDNIAGSAVLDITPVNDSPEGGDSTVQTPEDTPYVLTISDFPFSDTLEGDEFSGILITSLPVDGVLTLSGVPVMAMDFIDAVDIEGGALVYTPPLNFVSAGNEIVLEYLLRDSGDTLDGGVDTDPEIRTVVFEVTAVNDAPEIITNGVTLDEGADILIDSGHLSGTDVDDLLPQELTYTLQSQPENGALLLSGTALSAGDTFTLAELIDNQLRYVHDGSETDSDFIDLSLADGGEDDAAAALGRLAFIIREVIDQAPALEDDQFTLRLGETFSSEAGDTLASGNVALGGNLLQENPGFIIAIEQAPEQGTVEVDENGNFTYVHNNSTVFQDEFTYRITNEDGVFTVATVSVSIEPPIGALLVDNIIPESLPETETEIETEAQTEVETATEAETEAEAEAEATPANEEEQIEEQVESGLEEFMPGFFSSSVADTRFPDQQVDTLDVESVEFQASSNSIRQSESASLQVVQHNEAINVLLYSTNLSVNNSYLEFTLGSQSYGVSSESYLRSLAQIDQVFSDAEEQEEVRAIFSDEEIFGLTFTATAGIFSWLLRGGSLLASVLASTPVWSSIDPVKVFSGGQRDEKSDEVEKMFATN